MSGAVHDEVDPALWRVDVEGAAGVPDRHVRDRRDDARHRRVGWSARNACWAVFVKSSAQLFGPLALWCSGAPFCESNVVGLAPHLRAHGIGFAFGKTHKVREITLTIGRRSGLRAARRKIR